MSATLLQPFCNPTLKVEFFNGFVAINPCYPCNPYLLKDIKILIGAHAYIHPRIYSIGNKGYRLQGLQV